MCEIKIKAAASGQLLNKGYRSRGQNVALTQFLLAPGVRHGYYFIFIPSF